MIALDTNFLVHAHRRDAALHAEAVACVRRVAEGGAPWTVCFNSFVEFYGVVTHPKVWGAGSASTPQQASDQIGAWLESPSLRVLSDPAENVPGLLELAVASRVAGSMVYDARIANCCLAAGVRELWTVDRDFSRFPRPRTRNPLVG